MPDFRGYTFKVPALHSIFLFLVLFLACIIPLVAQDPELDEPELNSRAAVLLDAATGTVLYAKNANDEISPASLAKLMTIHVALNEVNDGKASLEDVVPLPRETWAVSQPPRSSLMFLAPGQIVTLKELLLGLAIPSGNDAAVAVALYFNPTVGEFVERMNREARGLGLARTRFVEPSGISEDNLTTALEFALFCKEYLTRHPETLADYHSVREFAYPKAENVRAAYRSRPGTIRQYNHNTFLENFEGTDGLKTGYIDEAGYNIAITTERNGTRFIMVILGAPAVYGGDRIRDQDGMRLLAWAFEHFKTLRPVLGDLPAVPIWKGKENYAEILPSKGLEFTTFTDRATGPMESLRWEIELLDPIIAPLPQGSSVGDLVLYDEVGELRRMPLITAWDLEPGGFFKRLWDSIRLFFRDLFKKA